MEIRKGLREEEAIFRITVTLEVNPRKEIQY